MDVWLGFVHCLSTVCIGYPNKIQCNSEFEVNSALFHDLAHTHGVEQKLAIGNAHIANDIENYRKLVSRPSLPSLWALR